MSKCYVRNQIVIERGCFLYNARQCVLLSLCRVYWKSHFISFPFSICSGSNCAQISVQSLSFSISVSFLFMQSRLMLNWRSQSRSGLPSTGLVVAQAKGSVPEVKEGTSERKPSSLVG